MFKVEYRRIDGAPDELCCQVIRLGGWANGLEDYQVAEAIVDYIGFCDNYQWILKNVGAPTLNNRIHFSAYCSQDVSIQQQIPREQLQRFHDRMDTFQCRGTLKGVIDRGESVVEITLQHDRLHPLPDHRDQRRARVPTSERARAFIRQEALLGTNASETYRRLMHRFPDEYVSRARVGYWWNATFRGLWRLDEDNQLQSCRLLVQRNRTRGFEEVREIP